MKSEALLELTKNAFTGTGIKTTTEGKRLLVSSLGSDTFREKYASDKVKNWSDKIERLLLLSNSSHKQYMLLYTEYRVHKYTYLM